MKKNNLTLKIFLLIFFVNIFYGQEVKILKESIKIENNDLELQELQLCKQDDFIYKKIQTTYNLFNGEYFTIPKQRLKAKKDLIEKSIKNNDLKESQIGFEKYDIYFNKNKILNISIGLQVYGSPWEDTKYYCFDLEKDSELGENLFINRKKLLQLCSIRLKKEENIVIKSKNLSNYKLELSDNKNLNGISLIFFDSNNRTNSGYPQYTVFFNWKEIEKYISPKYKSKL